MLKLTPLGTVSPYCYLNKKCPGFLVERGNKKILLDCGNGITANLKLIRDLNNMDIIISHLHSDHYGDLLSIAQTSLVLNRLGYLDRKVKVYIPWGTSSLDYNYLSSLERKGYLEIVHYNERNRFIYDDLEVTFSKNPHPVDTYSIKIKTPFLKLVYSSDTGYEKNTLVNFAEDADLLICESTFLKGQPKIEDNHLYAYQAAMIAKEAKVKELMLTHFWPETDKQEYVEEAQKIFRNTTAAEEGKSLVLTKGKILKNSEIYF